MTKETIEQINKLLETMPNNEQTEELIQDIKHAISIGDDGRVLALINELQKSRTSIPKFESKSYEQEFNENEQEDESDENDEEYNEEEINTEYIDEEEQEVKTIYPRKLSNFNLEKTYIGLLLNNPSSIVKYYVLYEDCFFEDPEMLNLYKSILFTDGGSYTPEIAKNGFNFPNMTEQVYKMKYDLKNSIDPDDYNMENVYVELMKLFLLRKSYLEIPIKDIQDKVIEITDYKLYSKMSIEEVESAINQVNVTSKFKQAILNKGLTKFLEEGANNLTEGLPMPFPNLTSVFKGIRKGETMAYAMPSNAGKSRFTINMAAYTAFVNKKKVLVISNEMSEEKMRLCLITTILNHPEIQKIHGVKIHKSEGELLEFKFRPDNPSEVEVDEDGFVKRQEKETQRQFAKRLAGISTEFNEVIKATNWVDQEINNSIYFINITDHTNEELQKVIINFYYKEKIQYVFYDTLKTDTANIGIGEELKKTATILSNIAQNFEIFIFATLQLTESSTLPINLTINDLAVSRTVKEVLDTLCLLKQINRENLKDYEYSLKEVDTKFYDLEKSDDPDVRYYACVVDKNRAGAKPKLLFKLNLAYNSWEELGFLRLKSEK